MKAILVAILFSGLVCASCESKPILEAKATPSGKATKSGPPGVLYSAILEIDDSQAPRKIAGPIFYSPTIQSCLREAILKSGDDFSVSISGKLSKNGMISDVAVEHQYDSLRDCLSQELIKLDLGKGAAGAFKIAISRVRTTPSAGKTYELDLNNPKKFQ